MNSEELIESDGAKKITNYLDKKFNVADDVLITMYYIICTGFDEFIEHRRADEGSII